MVLALASLTGTASACTSTVTAGASAAPAQTQVVNTTEVTPIVVAPHQRTGSAGHHHDGPHQHDHGGSAGCCVLCCCVTAPHVLLQDPEIFLERPLVRAYFVAAPAAAAKVVAGLPFRPPRTAWASGRARIERLRL